VTTAAAVVAAAAVTDAVGTPLAPG